MNKPVNESGKPLEIERKFLIEYPDITWLEGIDGIQIVKISQYYFDTDSERKVRIRSWEECGSIRYILTKKTRITDMTRIEEEYDISYEEYKNLLSAAQANKRKISKTRYRFPYAGRVVEVDIFPFWNDKAIAEIELESEEERVILPPEIKVIKDVSRDRCYTNYNLADVFFNSAF